MKTRSKRAPKPAGEPNIAFMVPTVGQRIERAMHVIELVRAGLREHGDNEDDGLFREYARATLAEAGDGLHFLRELLEQEGMATRPAPTPDEQEAMQRVASLAGVR